MKYLIASILIPALSYLPAVLSQAPQTLTPFSKASLAAYTPHIVSCPSHFSLVRDAGAPSAQYLGHEEEAYVRARKEHVLPDAFKSYLKNLISTGQDRFSGGAYRAALFEAGAIATFDGRNSTSNFAGFGGILQASQYMAGLSGGGWFVTALAGANMPTVPELVFGPASPPKDNEYGGFNIAFDVLTPFKDDTQNQGFVGGLILESSGKGASGHPVSLADSFGISLARHFANGTNAENLLDFDALHGAGQLFSDIANVPAFRTYNLRFPIVLSTLLSNQGNPNDVFLRNVVPLSNTKFEYNIFEFGSYDPNLAAFIPMQSLGTVNETSCVVGFDQTAFVLGSTADVFPGVNASAQFQPDDPIVQQFVASVAAFEQIIPQENVRLDGALIPNAFFGREGFSEKNEEILSLADGGLDGANLPFQPLLVKARGVQAIIALDVSGNTADNFADGSAMIAESKRVALLGPDAYKFPKIPQTQAEFLAQNLTTRPTFFGCDEDQDVPVILYFPNGAPPPGKPPITNASTNQLSFPDLGLVQAIIDQSGEIVSRGRPQNGEGRDGLFPVCVACVLADREISRLGLKRDAQCETCFQRYCYKPAQDCNNYCTTIRSALAADTVDSSSPSSPTKNYGPIIIGLLGANLLVLLFLVVLGVLTCIRRGARLGTSPQDTRYTRIESYPS
ncbi:lysophospholipase [Mycena rebaudengoi]|nr:lysophospholipase [Mycena rebaudengoi]